MVPIKIINIKKLILISSVGIRHTIFLPYLMYVLHNWLTKSEYLKEYLFIERHTERRLMTFTGIGFTAPFSWPHFAELSFEGLLDYPLMSWLIS